MSVSRPFTLSRSATTLVALALSGSLLAGCVPLVVGAAAGGTAIVAVDRRSAGMQLVDKNIERTTQNTINESIGEAGRVIVSSYNQRVLLTGEVPNEAAKQSAETMARNATDVKRVDNQLTVGPRASFSTRSNETWITSRVKAELLATKQVPSGSINVITTRGVVYLMGQVTDLEGQRAASAAAGVSGVSRVVKVFDIVSGSSLNTTSGSSGAPTTVPGTETNPSSGGVQTFPLE